ncbi:MAG: hypothetical protein ACD_75C02064G0002 [uncultured bacterium]|nr:MAG: hypothetical protein ACD_75C02064G0002 [uncultured bacterium]
MKKESRRKPPEQTIQKNEVWKGRLSIMGAHVVPPHDPDFWRDKPLAPQKFII